MLREYLAAAGMVEDSRTSPLFRAAEGKRKALTGDRYHAFHTSDAETEIEGGRLTGAVFPALVPRRGRDRPSKAGCAARRCAVPGWALEPEDNADL